MDTKREMLRHAVAALAYRAAKAVRGAPDEFASYRAHEGARTPNELVAHIGDLFDWAVTLAQGNQAWNSSTPLAWPDEINRFQGALEKFDDYLASDQPVSAPIERLLQGPVADALTHVGQLVMLRRLCGCPMRSESYYQAGITIGRVGLEQEPPKFEFD